MRRTQLHRLEGSEAADRKLEERSVGERSNPGIDPVDSGLELVRTDERVALRVERTTTRLHALCFGRLVCAGVEPHVGHDRNEASCSARAPRSRERALEMQYSSTHHARRYQRLVLSTT